MKPISMPAFNKISRPMAFTLAFAAAALVWRLLFLPVSQGAYTDGILQIDAYRQGLTFWPPLYGLAARALAWLPGIGLEGAARLVSLLAGVAVVFPLAALARRLFGLRAATWAMAAWLASPMALRWSLQVMTDMPMTALWTATLAALAIAVEHHLPGLFPPPAGEGGPTPTADPRLGFQWLLAASLLGALATLTRYQGILLLPPVALAVYALARVGRHLPGRARSPWPTLLPWLVVPLWLVRGGLGSLVRHLGQFGERSRMGPAASLADRAAQFLGSLLHVYWNMFESFLLLSPYFITYGLFAFFLYGLFRTRWDTARLRWTGWLALYLALALLALQSIFSSYQERYLLPLVPLVCLFAGHGLATLERHSEKRRWRLWALAAPALLAGLVVSALVGACQGSPFLDIKQASRFVRGLALPETVQVASNERYGPHLEIGPAKVGFWTGGRKTVWIDPVGMPVEDVRRRLRPNDVIVLSSMYAYGAERFREAVDRLRRELPAEVVARPGGAPALFGYVAIPLFPDLMQEPGTHQSPSAWNLRYQPQYFQTVVLRVMPYLGDLPPLEPDTQPTSRTRRIEQMQLQLNELQQLRNELNQTLQTMPASPGSQPAR